MANIKPLEDKIVVQASEAETTTASGLVIPDTAKEKPQEGKVLAVGPGRIDDKGNRVPLDVAVGDVVTINTSGSADVYDWVGLYAVGASNTIYWDWFYLNGTKGVPSSPVNPAQFGFPITTAPPGNYEFRLFRGQKFLYNYAATSAGVTVNPLAFTINGVAAPTPVAAEPSGTIQAGSGRVISTGTYSSKPGPPT